MIHHLWHIYNQTLCCLKVWRICHISFYRLSVRTNISRLHLTLWSLRHWCKNSLPWVSCLRVYCQPKTDDVWVATAMYLLMACSTLSHFKGPYQDKNPLGDYHGQQKLKYMALSTRSRLYGFVLSLKLQFLNKLNAISFSTVHNFTLPSVILQPNLF